MECVTSSGRIHFKWWHATDAKRDADANRVADAKRVVSSLERCLD